MSRRTERTLLLLILLLAAMLRIGWPGITEFKRDEALLSQLALETARGARFPLHGITSSVGMPNPPVSVYLFAVPYFFAPNPIMATVCVGLLNVVAVALTWRLARRYFGAWAALVAALLYPANPWAVIYARKIWAQDLLPPFVLLTVMAGLRGFVDAPRTSLAASGRPGGRGSHDSVESPLPLWEREFRGEGEKFAPWQYQVAHLVLLALTVQIHLSAVSLVPLTLVMLVIGRRRVGRRFWLGVGLAVLTFVPFALAALQGGWLARLGGALSGAGARTLTLGGDALYHAHLTISGTEIHALAGPDAFEAYLAAVPDVWPLLALVGWAALLSALWLLVSGARHPARRAHLVFGLWVWLPILTFTLTWTPSYPHYMIPLIPAAGIALAAGGKALTDAWSARGFWKDARLSTASLLTTLAVLVAAAQVCVTLALLAFLDTHDTSGGFGTPQHDLLHVRDRVLALAGDAEILVYGDGEDPAYDEDPAVWRFLLYDHTPGVRFVRRGRTHVEPAGAAFYLTVPDRRAPFEYGPVTPGDADGQGAPIDRRLANGVTLVKGRAVGSVYRLRWTADGPADRPYTLFVHLLDAGGNRVAQADVPAWRGPWRAGDVITTSFDLGADVDIPPDGTWRIGMYYFQEDGSTRGVDVLDAAGHAAGWWVDVPAGREQ